MGNKVTHDYEAGAWFVAHDDAAHYRFWDSVLMDSGCWEWTGGTISGGYGRFFADGVDYMAHRLMFAILRGAPHKDLHIDHLCRNRACVNPDHLEPVTPKTNLLRGVGSPAQNARKKRCECGAEFDIRSDGSRQCRLCVNRRSRERYANLKARGLCVKCGKAADSGRMCKHCHEILKRAGLKYAAHKKGRS